MTSRDLFSLEGKTAIITGGSRGLGREMALAFAEHGADVVIASRKIENCEVVAEEIRALGRRALAVGYHAASWDDAERLAQLSIAEFGAIDILVNNAGMSPLYTSLVDVTEDLYDKVLGVNLKGPFRLSALIGTHMSTPGKDNVIRGGAIINVSSTASDRPSPNEVIYGAAKAAINNLTVGLARTYAPHVRVNCIVPGPFLTDISKAWDMDRFKEAARTNYMLQRGGEPHEIVGAALYLASNASSFTTGTLLRVDGGPR
jgi:NAD(P)-dependent dehydrogenase (short-subunit alcohol dehydrogenase family)